MELTSQMNEQALAYLEKLGEHYQQAYTTAAELGTNFGRQRERELLLSKLQENLVAISTFEDEHIEQRNALLSAGNSKSEAVCRQLRYVQALIERVLQAVAEAERAASQVRSQLAPQLDARTKARQVRSAYAAASERPSVSSNAYDGPPRPSQ